MKMRTDILRMYKDIHSWVGIVSGLALFIAFYAGAITMFEQPLQRWASPPAKLAAPVPLEKTPALVRAVLAAHPEAARNYTIHLETDPAEPARVSWETGNAHEGTSRTFHAALARDGSLQVSEAGPSPVGQFIDVLHQQIGLMLDHEIAMPIMGAIALLYFLALASGLVVLLPSLVKDLFALRLGKNAKRMWLDLHNLLGLFSLPFHIVMALTSIVFAFHDPFYDAQASTFAKAPERPAISAPPAGPPPLPPARLVSKVKARWPGFTPARLAYGQGPGGVTTLRVMGRDPRYPMIMPNYTFVQVDPATARPIVEDYLGGRPSSWGGVIATFFSLHFGSFGGAGIRWAYFLLGLSGAFVFYTGNLLWIESRRKRERRSTNGPVRQSRATHVLGALTVGVPLGAMAGIALTIAAAKPLGLAATTGLHSLIYHLVFATFTVWALRRGSARAVIELMPGTALMLLCIPLSSLLYARVHPPTVLALDAAALIAALLVMVAWRSSLRRIRSGPADSVWSAPAPSPCDPPGIAL
ncbi:PepSY domain-containing protein [Novosphingobium sp. 1949]|uniref:PepSY domain-containing protein n=1 Tax=Novosphingobium organovorum TaxID=2930092 RepID=A0ABT0BHI6_9SPHN|nr:PepSY-associated TM helix domain-containing protein [Novosphingobium organovorum]MCJ2184528.1 PepSY domain-containing protein [Novosphingobium organovorum]